MNRLSPDKTIFTHRSVRFLLIIFLFLSLSGCQNADSENESETAAVSESMVFSETEAQSDTAMETEADSTAQTAETESDNTASLTAETESDSTAQTQASSAEKTSQTGFFLDTVITITLYGDTNSTAMDGCFTLLDEYEQMLSRTVEGSDVWNINHSGGEPTEVSEETAYLIETALYYSELSDGAFDITITPLVELWDVQNKASLAASEESSSESDDEASTESSLIPSEEEIDEALSHVSYTAVSVSGTTVTLSDPDAEIDLGGIAKGYIADRLEEYLLSQGIESALINLGGNVQTVGTKPDGSSWNIGIQKPFGGSSDLIAVIACTGESVVTSGTYERYFEVDGKIYHHILDPKTGYPTDNGLTSATILADSSTVCDALSTTCFVLGLEDGMELIEDLDGVEALFITEDETMYRTSGFPEE